MRKELLYRPHLLLQRLAAGATRRHRLRQLRGTVARVLEEGHIDSLELLQYIARTAPPAVIYDIGGAVGTWTLLARAILPSAAIHAFEPLPGQREGFVRATASLRDVTLHGVALGSRNRTLSIEEHMFPDSSSLLPLGAQEAASHPGYLRGAKEVEVCALDSYMVAQTLPAPDLIKLDVQGYEMEVLYGSEAALSHVQHIISEVSFEEIYRDQPLFDEVTAHLYARGFRAIAFSVKTPLGTPIWQTDVLFERRGVR